MDINNLLYDNVSLDDLKKLINNDVFSQRSIYFHELYGSTFVSNEPYNLLYDGIENLSYIHYNLYYVNDIGLIDILGVNEYYENQSVIKNNMTKYYELTNYSNFINFNYVDYNLYNPKNVTENDALRVTLNPKYYFNIDNSIFENDESNGILTSIADALFNMSENKLGMINTYDTIISNKVKYYPDKYIQTDIFKTTFKYRGNNSNSTFIINGFRDYRVETDNYTIGYINDGELYMKYKINNVSSINIINKVKTIFNVKRFYKKQNDYILSINYMIKIPLNNLLVSFFIKFPTSYDYKSDGKTKYNYDNEYCYWGNDRFHKDTYLDISFDIYVIIKDNDIDNFFSKNKDDYIYKFLLRSSNITNDNIDLYQTTKYYDFDTNFNDIKCYHTYDNFRLENIYAFAMGYNPNADYDYKKYFRDVYNNSLTTVLTEHYKKWIFFELIKRSDLLKNINGYIYNISPYIIKSYRKANFTQFYSDIFLYRDITNNISVNTSFKVDIYNININTIKTNKFNNNKTNQLFYGIYKYNNDLYNRYGDYFNLMFTINIDNIKYGNILFNNVFIYFERKINIDNIGIKSLEFSNILVKHNNILVFDNIDIENSLSIPEIKTKFIENCIDIIKLNINDIFYL